MPDPSAADREPIAVNGPSPDDTIPGPGAAIPGWSCGQPTSFPAHFGRYRIEKKIGQGAMGAVYLATDTALERPVALKIPSASLVDNPVLRERFFREARLAATLQHPNICPVYDVGQNDGVYFLVMAHIEGRPLSQFIRAGQKLPARNVATVVRALALAMHEAHQKGVIHRDLKPSNIMIAANKQPIITDFGLARRTGSNEGSALTQSGVIMGTPEYMPPEQIDGDNLRIGPRSDLYALGIILYELLAGRRPFQGPLTQLIAQIAGQPPTPLRKLRPELDAALESICLKALGKQPEDRYADMREFASALSEWLAGRRPESLQQTTNEAESVVVQLFDAMAEFVESMPKPKKSPSSAEIQPIHADQQRGSIYWAEAQAKQPKAGSVRKRRVAPRPTHHAPVWLRVILWTATPPLLLITLFGIGKMLYLKAIWYTRERPIAQAIEKLRSDPNDTAALATIDRLESSLKDYPALAMDLGTVFVEHGNRQRAERSWSFSNESKLHAVADGSIAERANAWWTIGMAQTGGLKVSCLWFASELCQQLKPDPKNYPAELARWQKVREYIDIALTRPANRDGNMATLKDQPLGQNFALQFFESLPTDSRPWQVEVAANNVSVFSLKVTGLLKMVLTVNGREYPVSGTWWGDRRTWTNNRIQVVVFDDTLELHFDGIALLPPIRIARIPPETQATLQYTGPAVEDKIKVKSWVLTKYTTITERLAALSGP